MNLRASLLRIALLALLTSLSLSAPAVAESTEDQAAAHLKALLGVGEGSVVVDIGAGKGRFAIALSKYVGASGTVYATELEAEDRAEIEEKVEEEGAARVKVMEAKIDGTGLPPESVDGAYMRRVYHHITDPVAFDRAVIETIRPGGRFVVIDFRPKWFLAFAVPEGIPDNRGGHGIDPELVIEEVTAAGFSHVETIERWKPESWLDTDYGIVFERPANDS